MRRRFVLVSLAVTVMVTLAFAVPLAVLVATIAKARALSDAEREASAVATVLVVTADPDAIEKAIASTPDGRAGRISVRMPDGRIVGANRDGDYEAALERVRGTKSALTLDVPGGALRLRGAPTVGGGFSVVEVFVPHAVMRRGVNDAYAVLAGLAITLLACSAFLADRLAAGAVRATQSLADTAVRLGNGDLAARVEPAGPPEVKRVGAAFNHLADRFLALLAAERELSADLSHRLRTPLTRLRLNAEGLAPGDDRNRIMAAADALGEEIDTIVEQAQHPLVTPAAAECDLVEAVADRVAFWTELAGDQDRSAGSDGVVGAIRVPVSRADAVSALDAVLGNVFQHTPPGVGFRVILDRDRDTASVIVDDDGPGIEAPAQAMRRGVSGGQSTGLGLDIARRVTEATGGDVAVAASPLGGVRVVLKFGRAGVTGSRRARRAGASRGGLRSWLSRRD